MRPNLHLLSLRFFAGAVAAACLSPAEAGQYDLPDPAGGTSQFGWDFLLLPNGNFVVSDPGYDAPGPIPDVGAVYLYDGVTLEIISTLTGSTANDQVGSGGALTLENGNFVVISPSWNNGAVSEAGAITWGSGSAGVGGEVSVVNSLVGSSSNDMRSGTRLVTLANGNFVFSSPSWDNGGVVDVGAVTWGNKTTGITGPISEANSLVGSTANDRVGSGQFAFGGTSVTPLANGNYVVSSTDWGGVGAVTLGDGATGIAGPVNEANSLVGSTTGDWVGFQVTEVAKGNYVVGSLWWDNGAVVDAGAVTWGNGITGVTGPVSAANSLVGTSERDRLGSFVPLSNGNYVVFSPHWDDGAMEDVGAVTWGDGTTGIAGPVNAGNSLVGSTAGDQVGFIGPPGGNDVTPLANGNYVVTSVFWDDGAVENVGAVTWGDGTTGITGPVSAANSLVGTTAGDGVGGSEFGVTALTNGNYVVPSPGWDNGAEANVGAVTWADGTTGQTGPVTPENSLVGSTAGGPIGDRVTALANGNYVVSSPRWGGFVGAATWGNGSTGITGSVSAANSLVGSTGGDRIGEFTTDGVIALANGNYVVSAPGWDKGAVEDVGAVTWGSGTAGITGPVTEDNSLVGSSPRDRVGNRVGSLFSGHAGVTALANGNYVVRSAEWDRGALVDAGAVTWGNGTTGTTGAITPANSLVGSTSNDMVGSGFDGIPPRLGVSALDNGDYVVRSPNWGASDTGALSLGDGQGRTTGVVSTANSMIGAKSNEWMEPHHYDYLNSRLMVVDYPEAVILFGYDPEIRIEHPPGVPVADGGRVAFGALMGGEDSRTFTVRNTGLGELNGLDISIAGSGASSFSVTAAPSSTVSGPLGSTTFTVRFAPASMGVQSAVLRLANNDADESPFELNLTGKVLVIGQDTDGDGLNDGSEIELAALGFDWQVSQPGLVSTLFGSANAAGLYTASQVQALHVDAPVIEKDPASGLFTLTIGVQKSTDLLDFFSFPMTVPQTTINTEGELEFEFDVPDDAAFFRLEAK